MIAGLQNEFSGAGPIQMSIVCDKTFPSSVKRRSHKTVCNRIFFCTGGTVPMKIITVRSRTDGIFYNVE